MPSRVGLPSSDLAGGGVVLRVQVTANHYMPALAAAVDLWYGLLMFAGDTKAECRLSAFAGYPGDRSVAGRFAAWLVCTARPALAWAMQLLHTEVVGACRSGVQLTLCS